MRAAAGPSLGTEVERGYGVTPLPVVAALRTWNRI
jgi:hypothetical protein